MKTKNLIYWSAVLIFFVGIIALVSINGNGDNSNKIAYSASVLMATESSFDFNTISMKDGNVSHQFEVKNEGKESVIIEKIYTSCMCTSAMIIDVSGKKWGAFGMHSSSKTKIEVDAGELIIVEAIFDPNAHGPSGVGLAERSIYLETNSAKSPKLEFSFRAMVAR